MGLGQQMRPGATGAHSVTPQKAGQYLASLLLVV